jgi:sec-independent protein translocase protein TatB
MFDLSMSELLVVGVVALIVIGPKDLPELFRSLGRVTAKMRGMAREFSRAMEAAADEAGVKDVAKDLKTMTSAKSMGLEAVKDAATKFEKWDPLKNAARPSVPSLAKALTADPKILPDLVPDPAAAPPQAPAETAMGPATQALADQQAARKAVALDAAEKLKKPSAAATEAGADKPQARKPAKPKAKAEAKAEAKPKAPKSKPAPKPMAAAPEPVKKPRTPRKATSTEPTPKADK